METDLTNFQTSSKIQNEHTKISKLRTGDVAHSVESSPSMKPCVASPAVHALGVMVHACIPELSSGGGGRRIRSTKSSSAL